MLEPLTSEQEDQILAEIHYSREQLDKDLVILRRWLNDQHSLPGSRPKESDAFLVSYLVGCKCDLEKAKKKLTYYYNLRGSSEILTDRCNTQQLNRSREFVAEITLKNVLPNLSKLTIIALKLDHLDKYSAKSYFKRLVAQGEYLMRSGNGISHQEMFLLDMKGYTWPIILKNIRYAKSLIYFFQYAYPIRIGRVILYNASPVISFAMNKIFMPLFTKKLRERITVTSDSLESEIDFMHVIPSFSGDPEPEFYVQSSKFLDEIILSGVLDLLDDRATEVEELKTSLEDKMQLEID